MPNLTEEQKQECRGMIRDMVNAKTKEDFQKKYCEYKQKTLSQFLNLWSYFDSEWLPDITRLLSTDFRFGLFFTNNYIESLFKLLVRLFLKSKTLNRIESLIYILIHRFIPYLIYKTKHPKQKHKSLAHKQQQSVLERGILIWEQVSATNMISCIQRSKKKDECAPLKKYSIQEFIDKEEYQINQYSIFFEKDKRPECDCHANKLHRRPCKHIWAIICKHFAALYPMEDIKQAPIISLLQFCTNGFSNVDFTSKKVLGKDSIILQKEDQFEDIVFSTDPVPFNQEVEKCSATINLAAESIIDEKPEEENLLVTDFDLRPEPNKEEPYPSRFQLPPLDFQSKKKRGRKKKTYPSTFDTKLRDNRKIHEEPPKSHSSTNTNLNDSLLDIQLLPSTSSSPPLSCNVSFEISPSTPNQKCSKRKEITTTPSPILDKSNPTTLSPKYGSKKKRNRVEQPQPFDLFGKSNFVRTHDSISNRPEKRMSHSAYIKWLAAAETRKLEEEVFFNKVKNEKMSCAKVVDFLSYYRYPFRLFNSSNQEQTNISSRNCLIEKIANGDLQLPCYIVHCTQGHFSGAVILDSNTIIIVDSFPGIKNHDEIQLLFKEHNFDISTPFVTRIQESDFECSLYLLLYFEWIRYSNHSEFSLEKFVSNLKHKKFQTFDLKSICYDIMKSPALVT